MSMNSRKIFITAAITGLMLAVGPGCDELENEEQLEQGKCLGVNSCKGKADCHGHGNSCGGQNSCKGKGWKKMAKKECVTKRGDFKSF